MNIIMNAFNVTPLVIRVMIIHPAQGVSLCIED